MTGTELIARIKELGEERLVILHDCGNTFAINVENIFLWDEEAEDIKDSPICLDITE